VEADNAVAQATAAPPAERRAPQAGFTAFFRDRYRPLMTVAMYAGATKPEADEAVSLAMAEVLRRWDELKDRPAYARKAVISNFIKIRTRGLDRTRVKQLQFRAGTPQYRDDQSLSYWEDKQWVTQLLNSLPPKQREVMACMVDGFEPYEIAVLLGRSPDAVRQSPEEARRRLKREDQVIERTGSMGREAR
jgi:RNA polymerase sigma factor (sigma-70 family)